MRILILCSLLWSQLSIAVPVAGEISSPAIPQDGAIAFEFELANQGAVRELQMGYADGASADAFLNNLPTLVEAGKRATGFEPEVIFANFHPSEVSAMGTQEKPFVPSPNTYLFLTEEQQKEYEKNQEVMRSRSRSIFFAVMRTAVGGIKYFISGSWSAIPVIGVTAYSNYYWMFPEKWEAYHKGLLKSFVLKPLHKSKIARAKYKKFLMHSSSKIGGRLAGNLSYSFVATPFFVFVALLSPMSLWEAPVDYFLRGFEWAEWKSRVVDQILYSGTANSLLEEGAYRWTFPKDGKPALLKPSQLVVFNFVRQMIFASVSAAFIGGAPNATDYENLKIAATVLGSAGFINLIFGRQIHGGASQIYAQMDPIKVNLRKIKNRLQDMHSEIQMREPVTSLGLSGQSCYRSLAN